ncbi:hypothetical protein AB205_0157830 [Aquarana catesbeiana]|uniref:Uncharacterized protein n=1 Tax=Aquarana catesbeiana TaxID=8400 RepID=A0A2G9SK67_AQUCT|nr:hypothetical protein AB205_0157830 [Aquarana catesbeiana]
MQYYVLYFSYSKDHPVFLQLSDYFWVKKTSRFSLPYGTMGSGKQCKYLVPGSHCYNIRSDFGSTSHDVYKSMVPYTSRLNWSNTSQSDFEKSSCTTLVRIWLQCKRCIVVGSGYRMKNSSLGYNINKYDIVIRMNDAPVHNYEEDVGSKTTLRFFYPESAFSDPKLDNNPDTLMVLVPFKNNDILWMKTLINNEKRLKQGFWRQPPIIWNVKPQNIRILNPYFMEFAAEKLLEYNETTKTLKAV